MLEVNKKTQAGHLVAWEMHSSETWLCWRARGDGRQPHSVGCKAKHCCAKHKIPTCNKFLVQRMGFEPTQPCGHWYLKPARMPFRHLCILFFCGFLIPRDLQSTCWLRWWTPTTGATHTTLRSLVRKSARMPFRHLCKHNIISLSHFFVKNICKAKNYTFIF